MVTFYIMIVSDPGWKWYSCTHAYARLLLLGGILARLGSQSYSNLSVHTPLAAKRVQRLVVPKVATKPATSATSLLHRIHCFLTRSVGFKVLFSLF